MRSCQGYPCVDATIGGHQVRLLIDTGDVTSGIVLQNGSGLQLQPARNRSGNIVPGYQFADLQNWQLGGHAMGPLKILVQLRQGRPASGKTPASDGALAFTAFEGRLLVLDYARHRVEFSEPLTSPLACAACSRLDRITFGKHGPPILVGDGFAVNGKPLRAQIDSLYGGSMVIYPASVEALGLAAAQAGATDKQFFPFTDGGVTMLRGYASESHGSLQFARAPVYFATPGVHVPDGLFEGTIGAAFLAGHVLYLNLHDGWFSIS